MSAKNIVLYLLFTAFTAILALGTFVFLKNNPYFIENTLSFTDLRTKKNSASSKTPVKVTLEFWGLWDNSDSWQPIIEKYEKQKHVWNGQEVEVKINYAKKNINSYEEEIKKSYAGDKAPNIFMINNYWLERYADKLEPLTGNEAYMKEYGLLDYEQLDKIFPINILSGVLYDNNQMFALPTYSDSLALYYNKDLFEKAGISEPPVTWDDLKKDVKKLTAWGKNNEIKQSGIALGTGKTINRSCDILSLLILQGGGKIVDTEGNIDFNKKVSVRTTEGVLEREPGLTAIQFYMEFSDNNKEIYSWNKNFTDSIQDFAAGKTAMMIGYSYQKANLLALKPELNYGVAPIPQLADSTPINIANLWLPAVSSQNSCTIEGDSDSIDCAKIAWSFLSFASQKENISKYLEIAGKAPARLDLIEEKSQQNDFIGVFAKQAKIARTYNKFDDKIDNIFTNMLDEIYSNRAQWKQKTDEAAAQIEALKK